jgi:hypothetical protein
VWTTVRRLDCGSEVEECGAEDCLEIVFLLALFQRGAVTVTVTAMVERG